jgi:hypothetical protein
MKKIFFLFAMIAGIATSCATSTESSKQSQSAVEPPVYYTGNNEPAASSVGSSQAAVGSLQSQSAVEQPECPTYYTGNDEPAASGLFIAE